MYFGFKLDHQICTLFFRAMCHWRATFCTRGKPQKASPSMNSSYETSHSVLWMLEASDHSARNGTSVLRGSHQFCSLSPRVNSIKCSLKIGEQIGWWSRVTSLRQSWTTMPLWMYPSFSSSTKLTFWGRKSKMWKFQTTLHNSAEIHEN